MNESQTTAPKAPRAVLTPAVDVYENAEEFRLIADMPGVTRDQIELELDKDELTVFARRPLSREGKTLGLGRHDGDFRRKFRVPEDVDAEGIEASLEHGVLQVRLPKAEHVKPKRIAVN